MSKLSARQERFAQLLAEGKTQFDAYKAAGYACTNDNAARACASRLLTRANVAARVAELRQNAAESSQVTLEWLIDQAREVLRLATENGAYGPAVSAIKEIGVLTGERVEKSERRNINRDADELDEEELYSIARGGGAGAAAAQGGKAQLN